MLKPEKKICVTFDDVPGASFPEMLRSDPDAILDVNHSIAQTLADLSCPAIGFVAPKNRDICAIPTPSDETVQQAMDIWMGHGLELGNHTNNHYNLDEVPPKLFLHDIDAADRMIRPAIEAHGKGLRYFRHPYLRTGKDPETKGRLDDFLAARGYTVAPVTIDTEDWMFAEEFARADEAGYRRYRDLAVEDYLDFAAQQVERAETLSQQILGRPITQTFLMHVNYFASFCLERVLVMLKVRGYSFVSLDEAMQDEAYQRRDPYVGSLGPSWLERWGIDIFRDHKPE